MTRLCVPQELWLTLDQQGGQAVVDVPAASHVTADGEGTIDP